MEKALNTDQYRSPREHSQESGLVCEGRCSPHVPSCQSEEARVNGLHAEAALGSQRDAEEWDAVAGDGQSAGLILKTVTDPIYSSTHPTLLKCGFRSDLS